MVVVIQAFLKSVNSDDVLMALELDYTSRSMVLLTESVLEALLFLQ